MKRISDLIEVLQKCKDAYGDVYISYDNHEDDGHHVDDDFVTGFNDYEPYKIDPTLFYNDKLALEHKGELILSISYLCQMY